MTSWNAQRKSFDFEEVFDFSPQQIGMPLEIYFSKWRNRMYVTTAKPAHLNIFAIGANSKPPKLLKSIATSAGAHHVGFSPDERYALAQNSLLNLPGLSDDAITVVDLVKEEIVAQADVLNNWGGQSQLYRIVTEVAGAKQPLG